MDLGHQRKLEGLHSSIDLAISRKRRNFTIHADELPAIRDALRAAIQPGIDASLEHRSVHLNGGMAEG